METTPEKDWEDISPLLDDALAGLSTKDRTVLLMRYFQEMPLAVVGQSMGISEDAAKKRVMRALERLRHILAGRGVGVSDVGLAGAMTIGVGQSANMPAVKAIVEFVMHGGGAHAGTAIPLAKGVSKAMTQNKLKLVAMKCIMAAACVGAGAAVVVQQRHSEEPAKNVSIVLADSLPASQSADADGEANYQACRGVLQAIFDSYDKGDEAAAKSQLYFGPDADPPMRKILPTIVDVDFTVYRLQKDAIARFGAHAMQLNTFWTPSSVGLAEIMARIDAKDCRRTGDEITAMPAAPVYASNGVWPHAPLYFHKVDGAWKWDYGRTIRIEIRARRRHPIAGETREQTLCAGEQVFIDGYKAIANDLEQGKIDDPGKLQIRIFEVMAGLMKQFPDITVNSPPR
jgi:hypothetical protein